MGQQPNEAYYEDKRAKRIPHHLEVLQNLAANLQAEIELHHPTAPSPSSQPDEVHWNIIHAKVEVASKSRYDAGHFTDAARAAFLELNSSVKEMVRKKTGRELDGSDLMHTAFSPKAPVITLGDLSTESGRSEQQGYMEIYAGVMTGIRNPKAHANIEIDKPRCIHFIFLASLLFHKLDERL